MLPYPVKVLDSDLPQPTRAPSAGQHTSEVLAEVAGYDPSRLSALRASGVVA
jgi:crotonobetainyl-CoA:carnitine CoA-transferase CaiB-like acyl-CoA transferase